MSSVPISGLDHQQALELLWAGHRAIDPIYCEDGGIIATFGLSPGETIAGAAIAEAAKVLLEELPEMKP